MTKIKKIIFFVKAGVFNFFWKKSKNPLADSKK
jgi:hypothetical protein